MPTLPVEANKQHLFQSISSTATASAATGAGFIDAGLAFIGMKAFLASISDTFNVANVTVIAQTTLSSISAVLATVIEYEIYKQNFDGAADYFYDGIKHHIVQNMLIKMHNTIIENKKKQLTTSGSNITEKPENQDNFFYKTYREHYLYLDQLQKKHHKNQTDQEEIKKYKAILHQLEKNVIDYLEQENDTTNIDQNEQQKQYYTDNINDFFTSHGEKAHYSAELNRKKYLTWGASIAILIGAIGTFMMSISSSSALTAVLLSAIGMSNPCGLLIVIAALSTIFFLMVTYKIVMDIICRDLIQVYYEKIANSWKDASIKKRIGILALIGLFIGFSFFAIVATGGTWWATGLEGQLMLFKAASVTVEVIVKVTLILSIIFTVLFEIKNMLMTLEQCKNTDPISFLIDLVKTFFNKVITVFTSPFEDERMILSTEKSLLFNLAVVIVCLLSIIINLSFAIWEPFVFLGHCFCEALTIDHAWLFSPVSITGVMFFECLLTDLHIMNDSESQETNSYDDTPIECSAAEIHQHSDLAFQLLTLALTLSLILPITYLLDEWVIQDKSFTDACEAVKNRINGDRQGYHFGHHHHHHHHDHKSTLSKPNCYGKWGQLFQDSTENSPVNFDKASNAL